MERCLRVFQRFAGEAEEEGVIPNVRRVAFVRDAAHVFQFRAFDPTNLFRLNQNVKPE